MIDIAVISLVASLDLSDVDKAMMMADLANMGNERSQIEEFVYETSIVVLPKKAKMRVRRTTAFDKVTKEARFKEEKGICQWCHKRVEGPWHAHHITPRSKGGDNSPSNLMVLHSECHLNPIISDILHEGVNMPDTFYNKSWTINKCQR